MSKLPLNGIDAAILVGGLGTRLRGVVADLPKPLSPVLGRPFLFYLLDLLALRGVRSVTLCCGYKAAVVQETVGSIWLGMPVFYSVENELLGTGGALGLARQQLSSARVLVMNGDSFLLPDFASFRREAESVEACLAVVRVPDTGRFGEVETDHAGRVTAFREKGSAEGPGLINGGVYFLAQSILASIPGGRVSLERQIFPGRVREGQIMGFIADSPFLDIGVPESYASAGDFVRNLGIAPHSMFPDAPSFEKALVKFGVCVIVFDDAGRVLLERRTDCGWWCLPGGKLEAGETVAECALREAREETGLEIEITSFLGIFSDPRRRTVRYPDNGDLRHSVDAAIIGRRLGGELRASRESLELRWFASNELPMNTIPLVVETLRCACENPQKGMLR